MQARATVVSGQIVNTANLPATAVFTTPVAAYEVHLTPEQSAFLKTASNALAEAAQKIAAAAPAGQYDVGRGIAAIDALSSAKNMLEQSVLLCVAANSRPV